MTEKKQFHKRLYTFQSLFSLFMVCAFPLHLWTLLTAFRDFAWVAVRTYTWDAIGLVSYALVFALVETMGLFLLVVLVGLLVPVKWEMDKKTALLGTLFLVVASWSVLAQLYSAYGEPIPVWVFGFLKQVGHPLRVIWGTALVLVTVSVVAPTLLIVNRERAKKAMIGVFERLVVLSSFYVFLDLIGIVVIVIRNIPRV